MATPTKLVTYEEWLRMPETNLPQEVVEGAIITVPPNKEPHAEVLDNLTPEFRRLLDHRTVRVAGSNFGLVIRREPLRQRSPDLALFRRSTAVLEDGYYHSAPELLVEVLSESEHRAAIGEKLRDYESIGVPEVWVVSPEARTLAVLQLESGRLVTKQIANQGRLIPLRFPEAAVEIPAVWPD